MKEIEKEIRKSLFDFEKTDEVDAFVEYFKNLFEENLLFVIFYGSCISPLTRKETSYPDFYVVVKDYRDALKKFKDKKFLHSLLCKILPPTVFFPKNRKKWKIVSVQVQPHLKKTP
jgi:hypothetical protein